MSKIVVNNKEALVSQLRFPEFVGHPLQDVLFKDVTEESKDRIGKPVSEKTVMGVSKVEGIVPMEQRLIASDISRYKVVHSDWFAYNPMRLNIGSIAQWKGKHDVLVSPDYVVFKCASSTNVEIDPGYLNHLIQSDIWKSFVTEGGDGGVRVRIYYKDLSRLKLLLPSRDEQQKIDDCLSSLDTLIAAQEEKVDALKTHKKGLIQQLFPREGETVPQLRFPEFRDSGEWEIKKLGKVAENLDSKRVPITQNDRLKGNTPYIGASGIIDYVQDYIFDECLLCVSEDGANLVARTSPIAFSISGKTWVNNHAHVLRFGRYCTQVIVENFLNSVSLIDFLTGMAQPKLNRAKLDIIPIPLPVLEDEQQKIADCLSSLETLVAVEEKRLDTLKNHKKGLMQQLFPVVERYEL